MSLAPPATAVADPQERVRQAWALLDTLSDPEIPVVSLREMGIVRDVLADDSVAAQPGVTVVITPTYSGCPAMDQIEDDIRSTLARHGLHARVQTRLAPAWTTDWMSPAAHDKLRAWGIAPPGRCAAPAGGEGRSVLRFMRAAAQAETVPCPRCGSTQTTETSHFGSTACKALYRCLSCLEPFDHFKPI